MSRLTPERGQPWERCCRLTESESEESSLLGSTEPGALQSGSKCWSRNGLEGFRS